MSQSPSEPHPSQLDHTHGGSQSIVTSDPLIPKPLGTGDSNVVSTASPVADLETTSQWKKPEQLNQAPPKVDQGFIPEESTLVWRNKAKQKHGDLESTDEWFPTTTRSIDEPVILEAQDDLSDLRDTDSQELNMIVSEIDLQVHQVMVTTPTIGWERDAILVEIICISILTLSLFGPFSGLFELGWNLERFGLFFGLTSLLWLVIILVALGTRRKQRVVINQAWVTYILLFPGGLPLKRRFKFQDLQEVSLGTHPSLKSEHEWILLTGKNQVIAFGAHLNPEERKAIFERLQAKAVNLQQGILS